MGKGERGSRCSFLMNPFIYFYETFGKLKQRRRTGGICCFRQATNHVNHSCDVGEDDDICSAGVAEKRPSKACRDLRWFG